MKHMVRISFLFLAFTLFFLLLLAVNMPTRNQKIELDHIRAQHTHHTPINLKLD